MDIIIGVIFFKLVIFSPLVWLISSSLSFWLGQNLSLYLPPLEKGDSGGFLKKSILYKISPLPLFAKEGFRRIPDKRE